MFKLSFERIKLWIDNFSVYANPRGRVCVGGGAAAHRGGGGATKFRLIFEILAATYDISRDIMILAIWDISG